MEQMCAAAVAKQSATAVVGHMTAGEDKRCAAEVVAVNLTATLRLIRTTAPLIVRAEAGRAVFVTSGVARKPRAYWAAYGATKAGLEQLALSWAEEVRNTGLRVNLFDPGATATRMRRLAYPGEDQSVLPRPEDVAPRLAALCLPTEVRHGVVVGVR